MVQECPLRDFVESFWGRGGRLILISSSAFSSIHNNKKASVLESNPHWCGQVPVQRWNSRCLVCSVHMPCRLVALFFSNMVLLPHSALIMKESRMFLVDQFRPSCPFGF